MENALSERWAEFDRMIRQLGAVCLVREYVLHSGPGRARTRVVKAVVEAVEEAVDAVCRFAEDQKSASAAEAWAAIDRAQRAARVARPPSRTHRAADDTA